MIFLAAAPLLIWIYLFLFRGGYWRVARHLRSSRTLADRTARVVAIVPARNEAEVIARSISSLLRQSHPVTVILVDDNSDDGTAEAARTAAANLGLLDRLTILAGKQLQPGWSGKLWALSQGVEFAEALSPDYLLFTDADIEHDSTNIQELLQVAESGPFDLSSLMVQLECRTLPEKTLIPAFVYFFFQLYPPAWIKSPNHATAGAAGGCILLRPEALARSGGLKAIRNTVIDDCALAAQVKRSGRKVWLGLTRSASSMRSYGSFEELMNMIARTAFHQLRHSVVLLAVTTAGLIVTYILPPVLTFSTSGPSRLFGVTSWTLMAGTFLPMVRFYKRSRFWALTLPGVAIIYGAATVLSALRYWRGRGGTWKGRVQDVRSY
ncbi:MAG: glycosyltransferase [Acidobacteriaceae bacterium]|nr:glycosyltransferase [Acidobacteriaceae bacterium]